MSIVDPRALRDMAVDAMAAGDLRRAEESYQRLAALEPREALWLMKLGDVQRSQSKTDDAVRSFREASVRYAREGHDLQAIAACRVLLQLSASDTEGLQMLQLLLPRVSQPAGPPHVGVSTAEMPAARIGTDAPDVAISDVDDEEDRITLEQLEVAKILPAQQAEGAPKGTLDLEIDRRAAPKDTGYLDLTFDEFDANPDAAKPAPTTAAKKTVGVPAPPVDTERLRGVPLLGPLPRDALEMFVRRIEHITVAPGDRVINEGDVADKVYIVVNGDLVATRGNPPRPLARLGEGAFFGEMALLDETPRSASVVAVTDCELLVLPRRLIMQICEEHPTVLATLMQSLRSRLIATLTSTSPLFARVPATARAPIVAKFRLREVESGTVMIEQGSRAEGLYVLLTGRAEVFARGSLVATLTTGDVCGEISLLSGGPAEATVRARTKTMALMLPADELAHLLTAHPQLHEHLSALSTARRAALASHHRVEGVEARSVRRV